MIWFNIALFVVSFLLTALLAPKPKVENARASELKDVNFPMASEDSPVPLVLGRVVHDAPNTIWYGNFASVPITEKVKTGLFSSTSQIVGYEYFLSMDLALGLGPGVVLRQIRVDDVVLWDYAAGDGLTNELKSTTFTIDKPTFFGGYKEGGGWVGTFTMYPGALDLPASLGANGQEVDDHVSGILGTDYTPAYLGISHIVFKTNNIGESAQLRRMSFELECYTNELLLTGSGKVGNDLNPAEAIYQIMTDDWRGMGINANNIDLTSLVAMGETLYSEGNGVSVIVTRENEGKSLIKEVLRQCDAISYQDPETGKIAFKLIRDDYDIGDLLELDESEIIEFVSLTKTTWYEVYGEVKVSFKNRTKDSDSVAVAQDLGVIAMIGKKRSSQVSFPLCYSPDTANELAARELSQISVPLFSGKLETNRIANQLRPGSVFKVNWTKYNLLSTVFRVKTFDLGSLLDGKIVMDVVQDSFSVSTPVFNSPENTIWTAPVFDPTDAVDWALIEMPYLISSNLQNPLYDGFVGYIPFVKKPGTNSTGFDLITGYATDFLQYRDPQIAAYLGHGTLDAELADTDGFDTGFISGTAFTINAWTGEAPVAGTDDQIALLQEGILYANNEFMAYKGVTDNLDGTYTFSDVYRGLLGTRPRTHPADTQFFMFDTDLIYLGTLDQLAEGDTLYYKIIDKAGSKAQAEDDVTEQTLTAGTYANRPIRPGDLQIDSNRTGITINDTADHSLTWVARDRRQFAFEDDAAQIPDQTETYDVEVYIDDVLNVALSATDVTSPYTIPFSLTSEQGAGEIRVYAHRSGGDTRLSANYSFIYFTADQP